MQRKRYKNAVWKLERFVNKYGGAICMEIMQGKKRAIYRDLYKKFKGIGLLPL